jgi:hypothetical protein
VKKVSGRVPSLINFILARAQSSPAPTPSSRSLAMLKREPLNLSVGEEEGLAANTWPPNFV